jgi:hypothetical protein
MRIHFSAQRASMVVIFIRFDALATTLISD